MNHEDLNDECDNLLNIANIADELYYDVGSNARDYDIRFQCGYALGAIKMLISRRLKQIREEANG